MSKMGIRKAIFRAFDLTELDTQTSKTPVLIGEKGRRAGESHGNSKLTEHEVELIRQLWEGGMQVAEIAEKMEVGVRYVYKVVNYEARTAIVTQFRRLVSKRKRKA